MDTKPFAELGLSPKVLAAVEAAGYASATPIQTAAIPVALVGRDVLGIAQTGTGKTAAFVLPMITRLETGRARARMPRSLILAPTRELAAQVAENFQKYGINHKLDVALLIGGVSMDDQVKKLDRGVDVLIATPGRLLDHFGRGRVMLMGVEILVIDEADRMLDMGFIPDIEKICKLLPPRRQTLFFSATMPPEITRLVDQFLREPVRVEVARPATTAKTITQRFMFCPDGQDWAKREALRQLVRQDEVRNAIIFCNRKVDVAILLKSMLKHGFNAGALHGDMDQKSRMETLDKFRSGEITFLAASDVAARGLDIPDVSHVFNFDLPRDSDDYVHRIGRTGRAGKLGHSYSLVTLDDFKSLKDIEKLTGQEAEWFGDAPTEEDFEEGASRKRRGGRGGRAASGRGGSAGRQAGRGEARQAGRGEARQVNRGEARQAGRGEAREPSRGEARQSKRGEARQVSRGVDRDQNHPEGGSIPIVTEGEAHREPRGERPPRQPRHRMGDEFAAHEVEARQQPRRGDRPAAEAVRPDVPGAPQPDIREPMPRRERGPETQRPAHAQQRPRGGQPQTERPAAKRAASPAGGSNLGFAADNIPAFMRRSARPVKAASE